MKSFSLALALLDRVTVIENKTLSSPAENMNLKYQQNPIFIVMCYIVKEKYKLSIFSGIFFLKTTESLL